MIDKDKQVTKLIEECSLITKIFEDSKKNIWISTNEKGLYKIQRDGEIIHYQHDPRKEKQLSICSNYVRTICEDNQNNILIGTDKGLDIMNPEIERFMHYNAEKKGPLYLSNESVWSLLKDKQGSIWIGTYFGGVNYYNAKANIFTLYDLQNGYFLNKPFPIISNFVEHGTNKIFLCTEGGGLVYYDFKNNTYRVFQKTNNKNSISSNNIKSIFYDKAEEKLWIGTHLESVCILNLKDWQFTRLPKISSTLSKTNIIRAIIPYENNFLVGTENGIYILDKKQHTFSLFSEGLHKVVSLVHDIKIDHQENLWIASIHGIYKYNMITKNIESYFYEADSPNNLSSNNITKIFIDSKNNIWFATSGGGLNLYNEVDTSFERYDKRNYGLQNDYVSNVCETFQGKILISTTKGLSVLDTENNKLYNFNTHNDFPLNSIFNGGVFVSQSGRIFVAGMNGLISFYEEGLIPEDKHFKINLDRLKINDNLISPNDGSHILKESFLVTDEIILKPEHKVVSISFYSDNYIKSYQPTFRYKLEGFSNSWTNLQYEQNTLNFMNLKPGKYNLIIEGLSQDRFTIEASKQLRVVVLSPFYNTWYAYVFYITVLLIAIWAYVSSNKSKLLLKASLEYEKKEKEQNELNNQSKLRFFTNISHEFRTPLTLIKGQIDLILENTNVQTAVYNRLLSVKRNLTNLQDLVTELLEFRKIEQGQFNLKVAEQDFVEFLYEIYLSFLEYSEYRGIKINFQCQDEAIMLWFDALQMQKVFYNVISNALKYTDKGGAIDIIVTNSPEHLIVQIIDNGIGIQQRDIKKIFNRFYQGENTLSIDNAPSGIGIGLALTKSILDLHSADIVVESQPHVGSKFIITLKKGSAHFSDNQKETVIDKDSESIVRLRKTEHNFIKKVIGTDLSSSTNKYTLLIVEDNVELCSILKNIFSPLYKVYTAYDGDEGMNMAIKHLPDIIISDLIMPKLSGAEMCMSLKNNILTSHIPIVLLTAHTSYESNIQSLINGADDYITKPFDLKTLILRCNNLVNNRRLLKEKFSKDFNSSSEQIASNHMDQLFLNKAIGIVENNVGDSNFNINLLAKEIGLGRTSLYNKIKGITGQTPNEFIKLIRLRMAAILIKQEPDFTISEIAYKVGFSTPQYFSKMFKSHFGVSPTQYRELE